jgi:hypothetical protein
MKRDKVVALGWKRVEEVMALRWKGSRIGQGRVGTGYERF